MVKLFGFRISPFLLLILSLECLALLISVYMGLLLYRTTPELATTETFDQTISLGLFLFMLLLILTPGFFLQMKIVHHIKKSINDVTFGLGVSLLTMSSFIFSHYANLNSKMIFFAALISACIGLIASKLSTLGKYWRFLIRTGVN